ncbi:MAG: rhomboid family intramembrane serine protease [Bacteroidales bacterium]|nr:rhomboid family intramembrane serine protease [Bacteroidales bacterium]
MQYYSRRYGQLPPATINLIIVNAILFLATLINQDFMIRTFAMFPPESPLFRWWQIITHMFMHGGFWHILFNMYTLFLFGMVVERTIGTKKFLVYYFLCGLGAAALHIGVQSLTGASLYVPTLGASGAVYGVLLAYAYLFPDNKLTLLFPPVTLSAKWMVLIFLAIELITGITGTAEGVAHFAHLGGALMGWLLMVWWRKSHRLFNQNWW